MKELNLTLLEMDIFNHRLTVPCAIGECLMWDYDKETGEPVDLTDLDWKDPRLITTDDIDDAINAMTITKRLIQWNTPLQELIVEDCVYDEVYICIGSDVVGDEISHQKYSAILRAQESLKTKFEFLQ